ncbi:unnamed protein product [Closterium sp. NIES-54]
MVQQVLQRFDFTYSSPQATPLSTSHSLSALPSDESVEPSGPYAELVGCLMYLMTCTRPDLAYPLSILACYVAPGRHRPEHMAAAKRVLRYLCSMSGMGLVLGGRRPVVLTGPADASWADDQTTQRSSQGYTFSLGSGSVSWRSTRSSSVLSSSCEAEIYAGAMAAQELRWLTYLLTDLGEQPRSPPVLYVDNKAMLALCREHSLEHRTKHIAFCYFLARELQQRGQLRLAYVASEANTADIFTKALAPGDHQRFCTMLDCVGPPDVQGSNANLPRAGPSRVRRQPTRTAASVRPVAEPDEDESNSEYRGDAVGSDDEDNEPEDLGMSDDEEGDDDDDDVAEEEVQSVRTPAKRNANRASGADKRKGKETAEEPRHEPRKKRATAPREKSMWSDRESTIFVAARWFTKDKFQLLKGKQGMQYWARLLAHVKESNSDWIQGINALQKQWRNLMLLWKEYKRGDTGSGNGSVEKPPWWPYMELYNKDTAAADPHAVDGGGATNVSVPAGMEVPTSSQPSTSTPTLTDPDGEDAGPFCDDGGDVNTVTPGDDDVEIWVRGADD